MARIKYEKVQYTYTDESHDAIIVNEGILKLAARDTVGITEDVVVLGILRKCGRMPHSIPPLGGIVKELGFEYAGTVSIEGVQRRAFVRMTGCRMTVEDAKDYKKAMLLEAKEKWRIERQKRPKVDTKRYKKLEAAMHEIKTQTREESRIILTFCSSKEADDFNKALWGFLNES